MITIRQQIQEVEREIAMRRQVYPRQVFRRTMRQGEADEHIARMQAVLETLRRIEAGLKPEFLRQERLGNE